MFVFIEDVLLFRPDNKPASIVVDNNILFNVAVSGQACKK